MTRSDLAKLEIPAGDVLHWLAEGWLNQVGSLKSAANSGDPVYAVESDELRRELTAKLATIGKSEVVFATQRVQSLLDGTALPADPTSLEDEAAVAELAEALHEAATAMNREVDQSANTTEEEPPPPTAPLEIDVDDEAEEEDRGDADPAEYFDLGDLSGQLEGWAGPEDEEPSAPLEAETTTEDIMSDEQEADALLDIGTDVDTEDLGDTVPAEADVPEVPEVPDAQETAATADVATEPKAVDPGETLPEDAGTTDPAPSAPTDASEFSAAAEVTPEPEAEPSEQARKPPDVAPDANDEGNGVEDAQAVPEPIDAAALAVEPPANEGPTAQEEPSIADGNAETSPNEPSVAPDKPITPATEPVDTAAGAAKPAADEPTARSKLPIADGNAEADALLAAAVDAGSETPFDANVENAFAEPESEAGTDVAEAEVAQEPAATIDDSAASEPPTSAAMQDEPDDAIDPAPAETGADATGQPADRPPAEDPAELVEPEAARILADAPPVADEPPPAKEPEPEQPIQETVAPEVSITPPAEATTAAAPASATPQPNSNEVVNAAMGRVDSFLGELRGALVDLAQRPQAPAVDMQPFVNAVGEFGQRVEHGVAIGVHAALSDRNAQSDSAAPRFIQPSSYSPNFVILGMAFLVLCWAAIFWFKTGSARLAVSTLVGANVLGCCLLAGRRR